MKKFSEYPANFHFVAWTKEDNGEIVDYSFIDTEIGKLLIANTPKGVCFLGFASKGEALILEDFQHRFLCLQFREQSNDLQKLAADYCNGAREQIISLHLKGTDFQVDIWKKLVRISEGRLSTYGSLVSGFKGTQAIGTAVGANPISFIIPCHRIVKNDSSYRSYHWGSELKRLLLAYELQNNYGQ
ncbi:MAG: methylated-DNA--[protein]-cysteine S-methyltransferase [Prevotellaceae bacterium]|jgi:AraC family transcriptional regulator of adaptative response/methylated-DNA-[protein]-cysteine methyltransferase|nr:methylated-DNA--[protein]-cysteine S-methyltransferase [Prevotellaceae bacterium]